MSEALVQGVRKESLQVAVLLTEMSTLKLQSSVNFLLALLASVYLSVNAVCFVINSFDVDNPEVAVTSPLIFHLLEFWATFFFNVVGLFAILYSSRSLDSITESPTFLKLIVFVNVVSSFISALLVSINLEKFETASHELEYANEVTMAAIDLILLGSLWRRRSLGVQVNTDVRKATIVSVMFALLVAMSQLVIYNALEDGEQLAHYFEFTFEIMSSAITFWFTMDNKFLADARLRELRLACMD